MGLLRSVTAGQRWGLAGGAAQGWRIAFKGGWGKGVTRQVTHQAALLTRGGKRVAVAILTADNPSDALRRGDHPRASRGGCCAGSTAPARRPRSRPLIRKRLPA